MKARALFESRLAVEFVDFDGLGAASRLVVEFFGFFKFFSLSQAFYLKHWKVILVLQIATDVNLIGLHCRRCRVAFCRQCKYIHYYKMIAHLLSLTCSLTKSKMPRSTKINFHSFTRDELINLCEIHQSSITRRINQIAAMHSVIATFHKNSPYNRAMPTTATQFSLQLARLGKKDLGTPVSCPCNTCSNSKSGSQSLVLNCGHIYCSSCVKQLYSNGVPRCPSCRVLVRSFVPLASHEDGDELLDMPVLAESDSGSDHDSGVIDLTGDDDE